MNKYLAAFAFLGAINLSHADNPVVIKFMDQKVTLDDLKKDHASIPDAKIQGAPLKDIYPALRNERALQVLLKHYMKEAYAKSDARAKKLQVEVKKLLDEAREAIELKVFIKDEIEKLITDAKLKEFYNEFSKKLKQQKAVEISIIALNNNVKDEVALKEINAENFAEKAAEYSIHESKVQGGFLGPIIEPAIDQVFGPEVAKALKPLKEGKMHRYVVKTKDGNRILIKKGSVKPAEVPEFEKIKDQVKEMYSSTALIDVLENLRKNSKIEVFTMEGKPDVFPSLKKSLGKSIQTTTTVSTKDTAPAA